ncbi:MAG: bifunctional 3-deoxy-7-phosphoheptulonate synthase/chorismate mutase type II [Lewinellaceae bacterium]|nr:bifunctional 3-deoxy-7-phosphoheptulonate synthase/chorismate mutase type II [Lewinellaceae bacterium]
MFQRSNTHPFLIAGPCSAETEEQVLQIAHQLAPQGIDLFRAGIWKPRTRPGAFEGIGSKALPWLRRVKEETGLKTTIEVANAHQVYEALKHGVDVLWIGARSTVNPFSVQEIADALQGVDVPVLIKNPVNPDLELWVGAIERIQKAGVQRIGAIHRGFSAYAKSKFRNAPYWEIAVELRRRMPELPIICDNSHICGNREDLLEIAQQALDLNYDGLMTETHTDPDNAWSDARQQITPFVYGEMIQRLIVRRETTDDRSFLENLENVRHKIDEVDLELLNLLARRMRMAEEIGRFKSSNNIAVLQTNRWNEILEKAFVQGRERGLSEGFIEKFLSAVHQESIAKQTHVLHAASQARNNATMDRA